MLILLSAITLFVLLGFALPGLSLAPWVPVRKKDLDRIVDLADLKPHETFCDLGCGNGRVVLYVAKRTKCRSVGIELSFFFYLICLFRNIFSRPEATYRFNDVYRENLAEADVIFVFPQSSENISGRLKHKLDKELKKGSRIISYAFPFAGWQPIRVCKPDNDDLSIYLYKN